MGKINERTEVMKQIQEASDTPIGAYADFDEPHFPKKQKRNKHKKRRRFC